ncbi:MAG: hypothetical protein RLZZ337_769 [Bacteroidota bacterium]|jgi:hypothetical protein
MSVKLKIGIGLVSLLVLALLFSPFNKEEEQYVLARSLIIEKPVSQVYTYLGSSATAHDWSMFVDHITPLNSDKIPDGKKGSIRRCFRNMNETGIWWDEEILADIPNKERELTIYNMHGFIIQTNNLTTKQIYSSISENQTELTLSLYKNAEELGFVDWLKLKTSGWVIGLIFKNNLKGIKREIENLGA